MRIKKAVSSLAAATVALSSFAAFGTVVSAETVYEKIVELETEETTINRVVVTGDSVPDDLAIFVVTKDGNEIPLASTRSSNDQESKQLVKSGDAYGLLLVDNTRDVTGDRCKYINFTGDKVKISSETRDVSNLAIEAYNAQDVVPTNTQDDLPNWIKIKAADYEGEAKDLRIAQNAINRFNNPANAAPMTVYNEVEDEGTDTLAEITDSNGNIQTIQGTKLYGATPKNTAADITLTLDKKYKISQVNYGNAFPGNINSGHGGAGSHYTLSYYDDQETEHEIQAGDTPAANIQTTVAVSKNHMPIKLNEPITTNNIKLRVTFLNPNVDNQNYNQILLSYIGVYDYGENLVGRISKLDLTNSMITSISGTNSDSNHDILIDGNTDAGVHYQSDRTNFGSAASEDEAYSNIQPVTITMNLGKKCNIKKIATYTHASYNWYPKNVNVYTSEDGNEWALLTPYNYPEPTADHALPNISGDPALRNDIPCDCNTQYIKLEFPKGGYSDWALDTSTGTMYRKTGSTDGFRLRELEIYGVEAETEPTTHISDTFKFTSDADERRTFTKATVTAERGTVEVTGVNNNLSNITLDKGGAVYLNITGVPNGTEVTGITIE